MRYRVRAESKGVLVGDGEVIVGRSAYATLVVDNTSVSRLHAAIRLVDGALEVSDLDSSNGTFVKGRRLTEPARVAAGDEIRVGSLLVAIEEVHRTSTADTTRREFETELDEDPPWMGKPK